MKRALVMIIDYYLESSSRMNKYCVGRDMGGRLYFPIWFKDAHIPSPYSIWWIKEHGKDSWILDSPLVNHKYLEGLGIGDRRISAGNNLILQSPFIEIDSEQIDFRNARLINVPMPENENDVATKKYVDSVAESSSDPYATSRISDVIITTTAETQIIGVTLPKDYLRQGTTIKFEAFGTISTSTTSTTSTCRIRIGSTSLMGTVVGLGTFITGTTAITNAPVMIHGMVTVRSTGTSGSAIGNMMISFPGGMVSGAGTTTAATINTTQPNVVEMTLQTSSTSLIYRITNATICVVANKGF